MLPDRVSNPGPLTYDECKTNLISSPQSKLFKSVLYLGISLPKQSISLDLPRKTDLDFCDGFGGENPNLTRQT